MGSQVKYRFSESSLKKLWTCHHDLQRLMFRSLEDSPYDITVVCGYRGKEEQEKAFKKGTSNVHFPFGKHNKKPSLAVDIAPLNPVKPFDIDWNNHLRFDELSEHIRKVADSLGINLRWWGNMKVQTKDGYYVDRPHYELEK
jgi:hypothetical protein